MRGNLRVLGIESTAHTFSASVVGEREGVITNAKDVYLPPEGSGIHPAEAADHHLSVAARVVREALDEAGAQGLDDVDAVAYSMGPGLGPCLRVGAVTARALSLASGRPLVAVNHAVGHIELGCLLTGARAPLVLLISGGHTMVLAHSNGVWRVLGETLDLTLGQLLDQIGRHVGFASPCGRRIEEAAARSSRYLRLPYTVKGNDVSFSGVLTAAKRLVDGGAPPEDVFYSVQETAFAITTEVTERALAFTGARELLVVGGVAANRRLSEMLRKMAERHEASVMVVPPQFSGDCGAQIAWTGLLAYRAGESLAGVAESVVRQSWRLDTVRTPWRA
ncbi:MAG: tRNA (adenosine(37)-N6)-threonylcarbamoyltransferase complex transferase subunit TsaD [Nitrososphaerota archaeon]|nr:tRNA (adenosine(37)-N6)-threonylcarbamoyltransferase complex transferase subunit TsaD [Nitrososphaerota archaeon]MDG7020460.1 tRNA (adenosine(37)-N6)-threonylcarbamoyltransferase complex transferase subunit TsaD [Nitrososphaerota archaeon]MDG7022164.1 tRNA (adenosine(37)-N6)-threonylcarbamoyltransferase complex transferase subunit TsaD [Nitrososphaerota archaeon]